MKAFFAFIFSTLLFASQSHAGIIFETGTGPFDSTTCCGSLIDKNQFIGTTFTLTGKTKIDAIGGHFLNFSGFSGNIFGAIVELDEFGLPSGTLNNLNNLLAYTTFNPLNSANTFAAIDLDLDAGVYGLIFGSGLFGATGRSALTLIQPYQVTNPKGDLVFLNNSSFVTWGASPEDQGRFRMFVSGTSTAVSEPGNLSLLLVAACLFWVGRRKRQAPSAF